MGGIIGKAPAFKSNRGLKSKPKKVFQKGLEKFKGNKKLNSEIKKNQKELKKQNENRYSK